MIQRKPWMERRTIQGVVEPHGDQGVPRVPSSNKHRPSSCSELSVQCSNDREVPWFIIPNCSSNVRSVGLRSGNSVAGSAAATLTVSTPRYSRSISRSSWATNSLSNEICDQKYTRCCFRVLTQSYALSTRRNGDRGGALIEPLYRKARCAQRSGWLVNVDPRGIVSKGNRREERRTRSE